MVILTCWVHLRIFSCSWFFAIPPQVTAGTDVYRCSDRSAAYEIQNLLQGGSELYRNLLMYGTPDLEHVSYVKKHLFPAPLGGLEAATPQNGWTFVQIPGALKIPQNVFAIFLAFSSRTCDRALLKFWITVPRLWLVIVISSNFQSSVESIPRLDWFCFSWLSKPALLS